MKVAVVGRGRVGRGLSRALEGAGISTRLVSSRGSLERVAADVIVLAVSDGAIAEVAERLSTTLAPKTVVVHCAGALGAEVLDGCRDAGAATAVMHPLVSFPTADAVPVLEGTTFVIAGDRRAVAAARTIAEAVGARPLSADVHGPAYHAAAALLANGSAALATVAVDLLTRLGLGSDDAQRAVAALLRSVADNVDRIGVPAALTGPVARGDAATVRGHRVALQEHRRALAAYDAVGPIILDVARDAGLRGAKAAAVRRALTGETRG